MELKGKNVYAVAIVRDQRGRYQLHDKVVATPLGGFRGIERYRLSRCDTGGMIGYVSATTFKNHFKIDQ